MAKERPRCVICGQETEFFRRATLPLYNTNQIVCTDCKQRYESASAGEQAKLKEQMLTSPYLWDRERLQTLLNWKQEEEKRSRGKEETPAAKVDSRSPARTCCGQNMQELGNAHFLLGEHSVLLSELCGPATGAIELAVCRCESCGQIKFFAPKTLK